MKGTVRLISNEAPFFEAGALALTTVLSFFLDLGRYFHLKDAGVKTHVLVGMGSCLLTLTSIYGFVVPETSTPTLDPSRLAAQTVLGIGFLGAGVILVSNDTVEGLTTAAAVWLSATIGVACGAGLGVLAVITLVLYFLLIFVTGPLVEKIPSSHRNDRTVIEYEPVKGVTRKILVVVPEHGYAASVKSTESIQTENGAEVHVVLRFEGPYPQGTLMKELAQIGGITVVDRVERMEFDRDSSSTAR